MIDKKSLVNLAMGLNVSLSDEMSDKLIDYIGLIVKWNRVYNLTAIRDPEEMVAQHLLDSLSVAPWLHGGSLLDVGSGAGLPGIPLAIVCPHSTVTLLDSNHKKTTFLTQVKLELGLPNILVKCERVDALPRQNHYDCFISRAFCDLGEYAKLVYPLCHQDSMILAMKGIYPYDELTQLPESVVVQEVVPLTVPGLNAKRHLVVLRPQVELMAI
ncbi:MAG: 16S rRNA (guanine(527)-N(7))-methyltransferase RsmG [Proteobacteria bacterium]|nr:16S rRNA (guanine(527)-N(7))-methyltransferase RsmG [Pseudomonadota bacterium]MDE3208862.1 16S rRNA (guanine(527)-N(7))-methyltransferase RsmG [Pseudomonadota bacterium]